MMRLKVKFWIFFVGFVLCGISLCSGKVFDRCELAQELKYRQNIPYEQVAVWVCIAQYQSGFNTSAVGYQGDGSGYHGMFQISDLYWCSPPNVGWVCSTTCSHFEDDDITDDLACMKKIYEEHQRISGDGFNAWSVYQPHCRGKSEEYIHGCFENYISNEPNYYEAKSIASYTPPIHDYSYKVTPAIETGKIYDRCELARELKYKHNLPFEQIATWVCIAKHESNFNTSAIGHGDHGLFQISDIYWCSPPGKGWVCGLTCSQLEDNDITDDVNCMKKIFEEHQRLSGDGFNAWTVYRLYCQGRSESYITGCFDSTEDNSINHYVLQPTAISSYPSISQNVKTEYAGLTKIYDRCELANELRNVHNIPMEQIATWVCIAEHESSYNTSAIGRLNADGSGDHGLFQISDIYWCSPPGNGWACGLTCSQLEDTDITDDVICMKKIYEEHQRISGDGFNAWTVYNRNCKGRADQYIQGCFNSDIENAINPYIPRPAIVAPQPQYTPNVKVYDKPSVPAKIYDRCELANELRNVHNIPIEQIATWVCIAQHESSFNTSAIGRLNADGSGDHGLFQISDIYWCSPPGNGWVCGLTCSQLEDNDITDDVICMKKIYEEHQRISGDGFNAWTVYNRNCKGRTDQYVQGCFNSDIDNSINQYVPRPAIIAPQPQYPPNVKVYEKPSVPAKIYDRCELANELRNVHNIPIEQIATWVCIAQHESSFNTSAIGRLNADGSGDHGLFQISDIYWCSPPGNGWVCGLTCSQLEDNDITDDVICMKKIYEEHQRISGDGFNAWTVYNRNCKGRTDQYVQGCFNSDIDNSINQYVPRPAIIAPQPQYPPNVKVYEKPSLPAKIYDRCELANELRNAHNIPIEQIATWVCIAQHESSFNTSAIGRLNADGSGDHGLFQISDIYWCSPPGNGWVCGLTCSQLEDNDITDDVICMKKIYEEHQRISGDGFNAWTVYNRNCKGRADQYIQGCFSETTAPPIYSTSKKSSKKPSSSTKYNYNSYFSSTPKSVIATNPSSLQYNYNYFTSTTPTTSSPPLYNYFSTTAKSSIYQYPTTQSSTSYAYNTSSSSFFFNPTTKLSTFPQFPISNKATTNNILPQSYFTSPLQQSSLTSQYKTSSQAPISTTKSFFNNFYQTQTTLKPYNPNIYSTTSKISSPYQNSNAYSSPFSTQYNTQTQRPVYSSAQVTNTKFQTQYLFPTIPTMTTNYQSKPANSFSFTSQYNTQTPRPAYTVTQQATTKSQPTQYSYPTFSSLSASSSPYNTQTQRPSYILSQQPPVTNTKFQTQYSFPTTSKLLPNYQNKPISSFSFSSLQNTPTQRSPYVTNQQSQISTTSPNYSYQYNTQAKPNTNDNSNQQQTSAFKPYSVTSHVSPSTQYQYNGQSYPTVKPFSLDYIKQITTPKSIYSVYLQSPSTNVEVTIKPTTVIQQLKLNTSLSSVSLANVKKTSLTTSTKPKINTLFTPEIAKQTTTSPKKIISSTTSPKIMKPSTTLKTTNLITSTLKTTKPITTTSKLTTIKPITTKKTAIIKLPSKFETTTKSSTIKPFTTTKFSTPGKFSLTTTKLPFISKLITTTKVSATTKFALTTPKSPFISKLTTSTTTKFPTTTKLSATKKFPLTTSKAPFFNKLATSTTTKFPTTTKLSATTKSPLTTAKAPFFNKLATSTTTKFPTTTKLSATTKFPLTTSKAPFFNKLPTSTTTKFPKTTKFSATTKSPLTTTKAPFYNKLATSKTTKFLTTTKLPTTTKWFTSKQWSTTKPITTIKWPTTTTQKTVTSTPTLTTTRRTTTTKPQTLSIKSISQFTLSTTQKPTTKTKQIAKLTTLSTNTIKTSEKTSHFDLWFNQFKHTE